MVPFRKYVDVLRRQLSIDSESKLEMFEAIHGGRQDSFQINFIKLFEIFTLINENVH